MFRILYIIPSLTTSGETHQLLTLAGRMRLRAAEVHVCSLGAVAPAVKRKLAEMGVFLHTSPLRAGFTLGDRGLQKIVAQAAPDVIHCWETPAFLSRRVTARVRKIAGRGVKIVSTIRRMDPFQDWRGIQPTGLAEADALVANNPAVRTFYEKLGVTGNWHTVADGVEPEDFPLLPPEERIAQRQELLKTLRLPESAMMVGCVGPIRPEKRWKWAVWSIDSIVRIYPQSHLLLAGNDADILRRTLIAADGNNGRVFPQRGRLETFARQYERSEIVHFLGDRDVAEIMPHLGLLWVPQSIFGSSVSIIQGMLSGVPIIATETEGIHAILPPGCASFVPAYGETLQIASCSSRLLEDAELAGRQAAAARAFALEHLTAEKMAEKYEEIYKATV